jgi:hypothetical protein
VVVAFGVQRESGDLHPTFASCVLEVDMKALPWIVAGVAVGVCVTLLLRFTEPEAKPEMESATGSDMVDSVARKTYGWGTKTLVGGRAEAVKAAMKEGLGRPTGNDWRARESLADR